MKITSGNGFLAGSANLAGPRRPAALTTQKKTNTPQTNNAIKQQMDAQKQRHLAFLTRAREGMAFYKEKIEEANQLISQYQDFEYEEFQELVKQARQAIPEFESMLEDLNQSLEHGIEENVFIMSTLEALLNEDGKFPVHTLEQYIKNRAEEEKSSQAGERPRYKSYSLDDLDSMISSLKNELAGKEFSVKA